LHNTQLKPTTYPSKAQSLSPSAQCAGVVDPSTVNNQMKSITHALLVLAAIVSMTACEIESVIRKADYFPTHHQAKWRYVETVFSGVDSTVFFKDTSTYQIGKDTVVDGKTYTLLTRSGGYSKRGIRKEGRRYYCLDFSNPFLGGEHLFLNDNLPVGSTWEVVSLAGNYKNIFTITAKIPEKRIRGKVYREVIEVQEKRLYRDRGDSGQFYPHYLIEHHYANNVGEVYAYYPSTSYIYYGDHSLELQEYTE
jgi:hypothetical protein